jgi:hypothetical protein
MDKIKKLTCIKNKSMKLEMKEINFRHKSIKKIK